MTKSNLIVVLFLSLYTTGLLAFIDPTPPLGSLAGESTFQNIKGFYMDQIIPQIYQNRIDRVAIADLAPIVFEQAGQGDAVAEEIIRRTGKELGILAKAVAQYLNFESDEIKVSLIGSIFKQKEVLINEISKELYEISWNLEISDPMFAPQYGAALLALKKSEIKIDDILLKNLWNSVKQMGSV